MFTPDGNSRTIAVLDLTHAGIIIAKKLAELGFNVAAIDVYGTVEDNILSDLESEYRITTSKDPLPANDFYILVSPAHLDPMYPMLEDAGDKGIEIITHHRTVGTILSMKSCFEDATVIEITGSKAKTSSASLLAEMLSRRMKVILHTSRGLELWEQGNSMIINLGLSIAPGSILLAMDLLDEKRIKADCYIFEVSIGLTGVADVGVITTLEPDYLIAASSSRASDAKMSALSHSNEKEIFFLNVRDKKAQYMAKKNNRIFFTFGDSEYNAPEISDADLMAEINDTSLILKQKEGSFSSVLSPYYNPGSYATAFAVSASVAKWMNVSSEDISDVITSFKGLNGRMQEKEISGRKIIDNSNSGMDIHSAERSLDYALTKVVSNPSGIIMLLGEEAAQVCEGLSPEDVSEFLLRRGRDMDRIILVGERMQKINSENVSYASGLEEGLKAAVRMSSENDIVLSCVKCFR